MIKDKLVFLVEIDVSNLPPSGVHMAEQAVIQHVSALVNGTLNYHGMEGELHIRPVTAASVLRIGEKH